MLIALDYDGTYTADPALWDAFIATAQARGHTVNILTMRYPTETIERAPCQVVYTSRKAKHGFIPADIYIDDKPGFLFQDSI